MITLFFSYSHRDEQMRDELEVHLAMLQRQGVLETWHDRRIVAGSDFSGEISKQLELADMILLLVSPYFLASDYCYDVEMNRALERHEEGSARVVPVILEPCDWKEAPFGRLLAVPSDGKPISKFANVHDGFLDVVNAVREVARDLGVGPSAPQQATVGRKTQPTSERTQTLRSSNLRVKKSFSDNDRDRYLDETLEYIANFFENSLAELERRNPELSIRFKRMGESRFAANVYRKGENISECCVRLSNAGFGNGITYSMSASADNSYNELLSVDDDGHSLLLRPMGLQMTASRDERGLSQHGAAEYLWSILMRPLQQFT